MRRVACVVCGEMFDQRRRWHKYCSHACQMRSFRERCVTAEYTGTDHASHAAVASVQPPFLGEKQPVVDVDGVPLVRIWGPNTISDFQLTHMKLKRTGRTFSGGEYYRRID